jgi:hypothetical protein
MGKSQSRSLSRSFSKRKSSKKTRSRSKSLSTEADVGYCVKCHKNCHMTDIKIKTTRNGRYMSKGSCPKCSTTVCRFIKG